MRTGEDVAHQHSDRAAVTHRERKLPHDDFRRAHYDYRSLHDDWRRSYDHGFRMITVSAVPVPSAFRNKASGSNEEGDNAG
jgi:hypothetical protein